MKNCIDNIIFDLDGTLTDSKEGIVNCLRYALESSGMSGIADEALMSYIGEPLQIIFAELLDDKGDESVRRAIESYRERFADKGIYENRMYEGMDGLIRKLSAGGYSVFLATIKPKEYAEKILNHFNLLGHFKYVMGSMMNGEMSTKEELIGYLVGKFNLNRERTMMVGDRKSDFVGAEANGVKFGAVLYGYGADDEFDSSGEVPLFRNISDMEKYFL